LSGGSAWSAGPTNVAKKRHVRRAIRRRARASAAESGRAGDVVATASETELVREARVFDVYRGEQVGEGRKSIAFAATFQSAERTLTDEDAAKLRERIVNALGERFGAELRA